MVQIFHTELNTALSEDKFREYLALLPSEMTEKIQRFKRWQDAQTSLMGKIMLLRALKKLTYPDNILEQIEYNAYGKPELPHLPIHFSISHSEIAAVVALSFNPVGVDIERIKPIQLEDFKRFLTPSEWEALQTSSDPLDAFYTLWTQKEAVLKGIGQGLNIPLTEICIEGNTAYYQGEKWSLEQVNLLEEYKVCVASRGT